MNNIFIWKDFSTWKKVLEEVFSHVLTPSAVNKIIRNKNKIEYVDDIDNLSFIENFDFDYDITEDHIAYFMEQFPHIRFYHTCRASDVSSYYDEGIKVLNIEEHIKLFKTIYSSDSFPELKEDDIEYAISSVKTDLREGFTYLALDDRFAINNANHYLKLGSEYLQALAVRLHRNNYLDYKSILGMQGTPTIFEVNLPIECIKSKEIGELLFWSLIQWVYNIAHSNSFTRRIDFSVSFRHDIPSKYIFNHYHPNI